MTVQVGEHRGHSAATAVVGVNLFVTFTKSRIWAKSSVQITRSIAETCLAGFRGSVRGADVKHKPCGINCLL